MAGEYIGNPQDQVSRERILKLEEIAMLRRAHETEVYERYLASLEGSDDQEEYKRLKIPTSLFNS